ncbi:ATP synthase F0 subcomplex subunit OSCP atp5 [Mortierella alpina]|nr:ATP synthase F0 subcomplex subunit OSCP atp5 [Mortierella alpina]
MALHPFDIPLIKDQVTQYLSSHDLVCLIQVSRLWSDWFIPSLWRSFRIHYRFRELTALTTPVRTFTVRAKKNGARTLPYCYHHYYCCVHTYESEDDDNDEEEDEPMLQQQQQQQQQVTKVVYTPLGLYSRFIHSLEVYKAIPVIFQEPCPYRFENLQRLELSNWIQSEEAHGIPPFLRAHPMIQELTLGYMTRDPKQMRVLARVLLRSSRKGLKKLSLTLTELEGKQVAKRLVEALLGLEEARFVVHDFFERKHEREEEEVEDEEEEEEEVEEEEGEDEKMQVREPSSLSSSSSSSSSSRSSKTNLRRLLISVPKALDTTVVFPFLRRCRCLERLEIPLRQSSQEEFGALCSGAFFPKLEQLRLHTDTASDDVITSILADESNREPDTGSGSWRAGRRGGGGGGLQLEVLKISSTKKEHLYPGSFWALAQFHGQTLTSLELEGLERMGHLDYNILLSRLVKLRHLKITISLWSSPKDDTPETHYGNGSLTTRTLDGRGHHDSERKWLGPTWGCVHLQSLHLKLQHVPSDQGSPAPPGKFEYVVTVSCIERSYRNIFAQIGKLKELRELVLQGPLNPLRLKAVDSTMRNEDSICRRLSMLSGLSELRALDIEQLRGKLIGIEEVVWMLDHWPRLAQLKGLERLSTKDVVAWLHARRPWMDIASLQLLLQHAATRGYATAAHIEIPAVIHGIEGRYATALYTAAAKKQALDAVETDLKQVKRVVEKDTKLREFLENPTINRIEKKSGVQQMLSAGKYNELTKNFFDTLAENGRLYDTIKIINSYGSLMSAYRGEVQVTITSAKELDAKEVAKVKGFLAKSAFVTPKQTLVVQNKVNPSILGGLVVEFGDKTIDLSVSSKINKLNQLLQG